MGQREECIDYTFIGLACAIFGGAFVYFIFLMVLVTTSTSAEYTVTITGVDGLDQLAAGDEQPMLSPVLNLTFHIDNSGNRVRGACVSGPSTAVVSYGDAFLGKGTVPEFCADTKQENWGSVTAWGHNVEVPRFLWERLSSELERGVAAVDVEVTMPARCLKCGNVVLRCEAKIGGGACDCWLHRVFFQSAPMT
ncbi:hypothetical protein EJB05_38822, partial [Eragrostis curvula]